MTVYDEDKDGLLGADQSEERREGRTTGSQADSRHQAARTTVEHRRRAASRRHRRLRSYQRTKGSERLALCQLSASINRLAAAIAAHSDQAPSSTVPSASIPEPTELDRARMRRQAGAQTSVKPAKLPSAVDYYSQHDSPLGREAHLRAVREGKLPGFKPHAKMVLVRKADMDAFIAARRCTPNGQKPPLKHEHQDADDFLRQIGLDDGQE